MLLSREWDAIQSDDFVKRPVLRSFHARAVVAEDINDECIVGETHLLNRLYDPPDSVVGVFLVTGIDLHLTRIHFLFFLRHAVPRGERMITRREFGISRNHAALLLPCERLLAQLVPTLIKLALVFIAPFLRHLVWRMSRTRRKIKKERFVRCLRFLITNPANRMIGHRVIEIKVFILRHADDFVVLDKERIELTSFSAEKSPEIIKAQRVRPAIERACRPLLRVGCEMPLADRSSVVAIELKNLRDGSGARRPVRAVARPTTDQFGDRAESNSVMVPARKQGRARRRTKRRYMESIVPKSLRREFVERGRGDGAAERGWITKAGIVNQHEKNVRRIRRSFHRVSKGCLRFFQRPFRGAFEWLGGTWQHRPIPFCIRSEKSRYLRCGYKRSDEQPYDWPWHNGFASRCVS